MQGVAVRLKHPNYLQHMLFSASILFIYSLLLLLLLIILLHKLWVRAARRHSG